MIYILFRKIRQFFIPHIADNTNYADTSSEKQSIAGTETPSLVDDLDSACTTITIYMREDGEFAVTTSFTRNSEEVMDITGTVLHMINSGLLADYFLQSLQYWGVGNDQDVSLTNTIVEKWKKLFDEKNNIINKQLAIDPSDVFALKDLDKDN